MNYAISQILMIILPIFLYQTFLEDKIGIQLSRKKGIYDFIFFLLALLFCMLLPHFLSAEYRFDLRLIPITLGFLYSGYITGILLVLTSLVIRIYLGGISGVFHYSLVLFFYIPVVLYVLKWYSIAGRKQRTIPFILLSLYPLICSWLALWLLGNLDFLMRSFNVELILYTAVIVIASWISVFLLENVRENMQMKADLIHAEKMNMLRDLTSAFAHEIRNPMQVTRGFLQLLDTSDLSHEKKNYIKISIEELDRANEIISEFLSLSKPIKESAVLLDVGNEISRAINIVHSYALTHNVSIRENLRDHCLIFAHSQKMVQCLINMLKNAIESMPHGGDLYVSCYLKDNKYVAIEIQDSGIGMTKEQISKLGLPFYSLKENGTGLGLMVSYQIIHSFKGRIKVSSEEGKGTTFTILLPMNFDDINISTIQLVKAPNNP